MKKCYYAILLMMLILLVPAKAQLTLSSYSGHIGYRQEYQDQTIDGQLSTQLIRTPDFDLLLDGNVFNPSLILFYFESDLTDPISTDHTEVSSLSLNNLVWNYYRTDIRFFDESAVRFEFRAMDGMNDYHSQTPDGPEIVSENRRQNQEATIALAKSDILPPMTLDYSRTLTWAVAGVPSDILTQAYSASAASANGNTSYNLHAVMDETNDLLANTDQRIFDVGANGVKTLSENEHIDLQTDYNRFQGLGIFNSSASYFGAPDDKLKLNSVFTTLQTSSSTSLVTSYGQSNQLDYFANSSMHYNFSASGSLTDQAYQESSTESNASENQINLGSNVQHTQVLGAGRMTNTLGLSAGLQNDVVGYRNVGGAITNNYQASVAGFEYGLSQAFNGLLSTRTGGDEYWKASNNENIFLGGVLFDRWRERSTLSYNDTHAIGDFDVPISYRSVQFNQTLSTPMHLVLRFNLDAGLSVDWYLRGVIGTTHAWNIGFSTGDFFLDGLSFRYLYSQNYDLFYRLNTHDQTGTLAYQWRTIRFDLRFEEAQYISQRRDVVFSVVRVF